METYEKIIGMKVVDGKLHFITTTEALPADADEAVKQAACLQAELAKGTYATKVMRPYKPRGKIDA